jgi:hypothetical protein
MKISHLDRPSSQTRLASKVEEEADQEREDFNATCRGV